MSHQTAPTHFFGIPLLDQPLVVRIPSATSAILAFVVGHPSFHLFFFGLGRNLPHLLVCQQLKTVFGWTSRDAVGWWWLWCLSLLFQHFLIGDGTCSGGRHGSCLGGGGDGLGGGGGRGGAGASHRR